MFKLYLQIVKITAKVLVLTLSLAFLFNPKTLLANSTIVSFTEIGEHTWTVPSGVTKVDVLVVGGGGGGGRGSNNGGGGGGAGGLIIEENYSISSGEEIVIIVGEGGDGKSPGEGGGDNGGDSSFASLVAIGGGGGGSYSGANSSANDGGSGGGGRGSGSMPGSALQPSSVSGGYGHDGGPPPTGGDAVGGSAGGGAGEIGGQAIAGSGPGAKGGDGLYYGNIFGDEYGENGWFAGGGAGNSGSDGGEGGSGGLGGGGNGGGIIGDNFGEDGIANTGGGGGAGHSGSSGNGGSGIVLIRYNEPLNLNSGLVGHWPLNQSNYSAPTVFDTSPYSNDGTNYGATLTEDRLGNENEAMSFNGSGDYVSLNSSIIPENEFTISAWVMRSGSGYSMIIDQYQAGSPGRFAFRVGDTNTLMLAFFSSATQYYYANTVLPLNTWIHAAATRDHNNEVKIYFNGNLDITPFISDYSIIQSINTGIGGPYQYHNGSISDVRIYNRALSEEEIRLLAIYEPREENNIRGRALLRDSEEYIFFNCMDEEGGTFPFRFPFILGGDPCATVHAGLVSNYGVHLDYADFTFHGFARYQAGGLIAFRAGIPEGEDYSFVANCTDTDASECNADNNCSACYDETSGYVYGWARDMERGEWIDLSFDQVGIRNSGDRAGFFFGTAEHESLGEISFDCNDIVGNCSSYDNYEVYIWPLDVREMSAPNWNFANACTDTSLKTIFRWQRRSGFQTHFEVLMNTENNTSTAWSSGKIAGSASQLICPGDFCSPSPALDYSQSYYWWLKLYDDNVFEDTGWIQFNRDNPEVSCLLTDNNSFNQTNSLDPELTFTTYQHEFPSPVFSWEDAPDTNFIAGTSTEFFVHSDTYYYLSDNSKRYFNDSGFVNNFLWSAIPVDGVKFSSSTGTSTGIIFETIEDEQQVYLRLTDPTGYYCSYNSGFLTINYNLPLWREVKAE
jgi:hypothetical protein